MRTNKSGTERLMLALAVALCCAAAAAVSTLSYSNPSAPGIAAAIEHALRHK